MAGRHAYRTPVEIEPPAHRAWIEPDMLLLSVVLFIASLIDVVGVARRGVPAVGIHALSPIALVGCTVAMLAAAAGAIRRRLAR